MRKFLALWLLSALSVPAFAAMDELVKDINIVQPYQSKDAPHFLSVNRYALKERSELGLHNLVRDVVRDMGSDKSKQVKIIWADKAQRLYAESVRNALAAKGIKNIRMVANAGKGAMVYPLFVEVQHFGARTVDCRFDTAEDMMSFDSYNPCATKNNYRIQLKN
ncbi:pilus assembly protein RcpB [Mesocricetibacter intestinalis]|uniref:Pilus assembly protein RcpB n=1 Tax=Mesocricetibacter intestinalis TaxID=1521930 RepID=A0A4R6VBR3_9PAST|nr:protein RcpB [Mesocricetibacter intestinalis]TDQ57637.1 pilus assembly protein RcpB [Mesocricetibacter intestinalis]